MPLDNNLYYFDKETLTKHTLGEIQCGVDGFNMGFALDGTKDSFKVEVQSFSIDSEIEPNLICYHTPTNSWWIVQHDNVERKLDESGFLYIHTLQLIGAIELFNSRDLTDCGFSDNNYTFETFIIRLINMSTWEINTWINYNSLVNKDITVEFLKTFENYTLLSALREFLDSYNLSATISFTTLNNQINGCQLNIISKSGNGSVTHLMSEFNQVEQKMSIDRNSFGTVVVSNAENVVSTTTKTYPTVGGVKLSSNDYKVTPSNALIRLPTKVHHVNWLQMGLSKVSTYVSFEVSAYGTTYPYSSTSLTFDPNDRSSIIEFLDNINNDINNSNMPQNCKDYIVARLNSQRETLINSMLGYGNIKFTNATKYDPINDDWYDGYPHHYFNNGGNKRARLFLSNKTMHSGVKDPWQIMYWEKGSEEVNEFNFWSEIGTNGKIYSEDVNSQLVLNDQNIQIEEYTMYNIGQILIGDTNLAHVGQDIHYDYKYTLFKVNYTPMSDIKVKIDNTNISKDIQLYNQNGKLTDSNALSKLLNSYSKEIQSPSITKYKTFYFSQYAGQPKVGDIVIEDILDSSNNVIRTDRYVINNVSMDFYMHENDNFFVMAEFSMSLNVATKSLLTNPISNIRDYGIPQTNTIRRKQLYRDFWELDYNYASDSDTAWYLPLNTILNFDTIVSDISDYVAAIRVIFNDNSDYYYQLDTSKYYLKKNLYIITDFKDNNIIGYDMQTISSGFDISRIISGAYDDMNTPVSYVDEQGKVKQIDIEFCTGSQMESNYSNSAIRNHCFINGQTWANCYANKSFEISEESYYKDPLEIPVFEYACQIDSTDNIEVCDEIITQANNEKDYFYAYSFGYANRGIASETNAVNYVDTLYIAQLGGNDCLVASKGVSISVSTNEISLSLKGDKSWTIATKSVYWQGSAITTLDTTKDLIVFAHKVYSNGAYSTTPILILRNLSKATFDSTTGTISIRASHYKVK